ncbi:hypothetical protein EDB19DRAFT_1836212 [Suillus lakei]|nr:hypothetical protein EDB19DRAFT_1836212 [Suillus lakei]
MFLSQYDLTITLHPVPSPLPHRSPLSGHSDVLRKRPLLNDDDFLNTSIFLHRVSTRAQPGKTQAVSYQDGIVADPIPSIRLENTAHADATTLLPMPHPQQNAWSEGDLLQRVPQATVVSPAYLFPLDTLGVVRDSLKRNFFSDAADSDIHEADLILVSVNGPTKQSVGLAIRTIATSSKIIVKKFTIPVLRLTCHRMETQYFG